jgi:hypothetical protein
VLTKDMERYYYLYDVYVDEDGKILDLCSCKPEDDCFFKKQWMEDGSPTHVTQEMWNALDEEDLKPWDGTLSDELDKLDDNENN